MDRHEVENRMHLQMSDNEWESFLKSSDTFVYSFSGWLRLLHEKYYLREPILKDVVEVIVNLIKGHKEQ